MALRECRECGYASDNLEDFRKARNSKYGRDNLCSKCASNAANERLRKRKELIDDIKRGRPCEICGHSFPPCAMDFHHKHKSEKSFNIGNAKGVPLETLMKEIQQCMLVCACCHRILHAETGDDDFGI